MDKPIKVARDRLSWWVGLPAGTFYEEARRRSNEIADSTFGTWSNKGPTTVRPSRGEEDLDMTSERDQREADGP